MMMCGSPTDRSKSSHEKPEKVVYEVSRKGIKQVLLTGQSTALPKTQPQEQIEEPNRERLVKIVKERGKPWAIAALVDGSIGYHSVESAEQMITGLLEGKAYGGSERCVCCFYNDPLAEIDHDFGYFAGKDKYSEERVKLLVNYVREVLRMNRKRGRARSWLEQTTESMLYPTSNLKVPRGTSGA
jgi:hypothetical protein